jgi:hypothetical protein
VKTPDPVIKALRALAEHRCEYCHVPDDDLFLPHVVDHIIAKQHGGESDIENLALCCGRCNRHKGPNISGVDPASGQLVRLFHPRRDGWREHFAYRDAVLAGLTHVGRTTVVVLAINLPLRVLARTVLIERGVTLA